ncbi:CCT domain-containing protein, partial [Psidium guajava]
AKVQEERFPEECNLKVGRYSVEERKHRILRYLKKRNERNFNKTIKYACRKSLADRRVRVRGRFARNSNSCAEEEMAAVKKNEYPQLDKGLFFGDDVQMKPDEEDEWVQEALADLLYLPYTSASDRYPGAYDTML